MEQIAVTHVSKDFPDASGKPFRALRDISFVCTKGENISLMGESGWILRQETCPGVNSAG